MPDIGPIAIDGITPAGAACAAVLARAGVRSRVAGGDPISGGPALISSSILDELGITGAISANRVERVIEQVLSEDSAMDTAAPAGDLVAVQVPEIVAALLGIARSGGAPGGGEPVLRVDATEIRLGDPELQDDAFLPLSALQYVVDLEWDSGPDELATWIRMTGDPLRDVKARAALFTAPDWTALTLTVPTEALVDTSIALPDVLSRLLAHPSVAAAIPAEAPMRTATRLLRTNEVVHLSLNRSLRVRIGAAAGLADPVLLDRELRSGMNAGLEIASALSEGRISLARLSRLARLKTALAVNSPH